MKTKAKTTYSAGPVPKEALAYFRAKGWKVGFDHRDVWRAEHAQAFTVAKAMEIDVLENIRGAVDAAIADGTTFRDLQTTLEPTLKKLGWWGKKEVVDPKTGKKVLAQLGSPRRLKVIYATNLRTAYAEDQWARIERTKKSRPFLKYRLGPSEKHRAEHVQWNGLVLAVDDPWWDAHFPPNGWGCKCWAQHLRKATPGTAPPTRTKKWKNPRTGEIEKVPEGIDPGFDFNPGKARVAEQLGRFKERLNTVSPTVAEAVQRAWMQPEVFGQWRRKPQGKVPVAALDADAQRLLGADTRTVLVSDWTMKKQDGKHPLMKNGQPTPSKGHPELEDWEYCLLPEILTRGRIIQLSERKVAYFHHQGTLYEAVVKATDNPLETFVDSFHRVDKGQPARELRKKGAKEIRSEK